jgi:hypothetical protein
MEKKVIRTLNVYYYGVMLLTLVVGFLVNFLVDKGHLSTIDMDSTLGTNLQIAIMIDALLTIPLGLSLCKRRCVKLSSLTDENLKLKGYLKAAKWRIILVSNTMLFAFVANSMLVRHITEESSTPAPRITTMMALVAVSAIAWWFTKPSEGKMQLELEPKDSNQEQY